MYNNHQKSIEMPEQLANEILNYLAGCPYKDVFGLIQQMQMCRPVFNDSQVMPPQPIEIETETGVDSGRGESGKIA